MEQETPGTLLSVRKLWWLKVNTKPIRAHLMDGAVFPHILQIQYTANGKSYICKKWLRLGQGVPAIGTILKVYYRKDKPSKARVEL